MRKLFTITFSAACLALLAAAPGQGVPIEILDDPTHPLSQPVPPQSETKAAPSAGQAAAEVVVASGDTVTLFCDIATFKWGTFGGTDCWGWTGPDGTEYAIMGTFDGIRFVNATTLQEVDFVQGPQDLCGGARWRDMKTYSHYCYAVSECSGTNAGLMVIDLQYLPDSVHFVGAFPTSSSNTRTSHNLSIDTIQGYAYVEGSSSAGFGIHILDLADPEVPTYVNSFGPSQGIHDLYAMNDTVYLAEGWDPNWSIYDLSNKNVPQLITRVTIPSSGYVHNIWPTDDRNYVVTTEETAGKTVKVWDISDLQNVSLAGTYLAPSGLAHNAQMRGDTIYISHYESGARVVDISDATNPTEIAAFDTYAGESPNFNGNWGIYQYTQSGLVYASNMDGTLFILQEDQVVLADTMKVDSLTVQGGQQIRVDISVTNTLPLRSMTIPFDYAGDVNITFDSVSTQGTRTDYFEEVQFNAVSGTKRSYTLTSSFSGTSPDLPVGSGPVFSIYFTIPAGASGVNPVSLINFSGSQPTLSHPCVSFLPDTVSGEIEMVQSLCCENLRGNVDADASDDVNVSDLTYLIGFLFQGGPSPACEAEANVDGDIFENIDVSDVTYLVDFLFRGGGDPRPCP